MAYIYKGKNKAAKKPMRKRRYVRRYRKTKSTFCKKVQHCLKRIAEKKIQVYGSTLSPFCLSASSASLAGNYIVVTPSQSTSGYTVSLGTGDNQRIGNRVTTSRLLHKVVIAPNPYDATTNPYPEPVMVRFWYFKSKFNPVSDVAASQFCGVSANAFTYGNGTRGLQGNLLDINAKLNADDYTYLTHRDFKVGYALNNGSGSSAVYQQFANNDYKLTIKKTIDLTKYCPKVIKFDDASKVTTSWIFCLIQVISSDFVGLASTNQLVTVANEIDYTYTDD